MIIKWTENWKSGYKMFHTKKKKRNKEIVIKANEDKRVYEKLNFETIKTKTANQIHIMYV